MAAGLDPVLKIQARECPGDVNLDCAHKIYSEGLGLAAQLERDAHTSLSGLESLLRLLAEMPGRKSVVLVTGGLLVSDRLDGRPDVGMAARAMGQAVAKANATVYTVQIDSTATSAGRASRRGRGDTDLARDRALLGNWLENFSRAAGGQRIEVPVGGGEFAFDRVLMETSAYYLLGVEPADADRTGEPRKLSVKVDRRGLTVRSRQWVVVPPKTRRAENLPEVPPVGLEPFSLSSGGHAAESLRFPAGRK
jgi:VWFA-related protein